VAYACLRDANAEVSVLGSGRVGSGPVTARRRAPAVCWPCTAGLASQASAALVIAKDASVAIAPIALAPLLQRRVKVSEPALVAIAAAVGIVALR